MIRMITSSVMYSETFCKNVWITLNTLPLSTNGKIEKKVYQKQLKGNKIKPSEIKQINHHFSKSYWSESISHETM